MWTGSLYHLELEDAGWQKRRREVSNPEMSQGALNLSLYGRKLSLKVDCVSGPEVLRCLPPPRTRVAVCSKWGSWTTSLCRGAGTGMTRHDTTGRGST